VTTKNKKNPKKDDDEAGPWCYTTDPNVRFGYCNVPECSYGTSDLTTEANIGVVTVGDNRKTQKNFIQKKRSKKYLPQKLFL